MDRATENIFLRIYLANLTNKYTVSIQLFIVTPLRNDQQILFVVTLIGKQWFEDFKVRSRGFDYHSGKIFLNST